MRLSLVPSVIIALTAFLLLTRTSAFGRGAKAFVLNCEMVGERWSMRRAEALLSTLSGRSDCLWPTGSVISISWDSMLEPTPKDRWVSWGLWRLRWRPFRLSSFAKVGRGGLTVIFAFLSLDVLLFLLPCFLVC
jgi:hypothetical protein